MWRSVGALGALCLAVAACGSSDDSPAGPDPEGLVSCTNDPRLDVYASGLEKAGELGALTFRFSDFEPAPPAKGSNTFHLALSDASGAAVSGDVAVDLLMPDHGHGTTITPRVEFDAALGTYTISPLYLFMPGVWRIEFEAFAAGEAAALDRVTLHFCVEG